MVIGLAGIQCLLLAGRHRAELAYGWSNAYFVDEGQRFFLPQQALVTAGEIVGQYLETIFYTESFHNIAGPLLGFFQ